MNGRQAKKLRKSGIIGPKPDFDPDANIVAITPAAKGGNPGIVFYFGHMQYFVPLTSAQNLYVQMGGALSIAEGKGPAKPEQYMRVVSEGELW